MFQNLKPIVLEDHEIQKANTVAKENNVSYELASLVLFGNKKLIPKIFTIDEIPKALKHKYPRIFFTCGSQRGREQGEGSEPTARQRACGLVTPLRVNGELATWGGRAIGGMRCSVSDGGAMSCLVAMSCSPP
jgi:hypothetical protein